MTVTGKAGEVVVGVEAVVELVPFGAAVVVPVVSAVAAVVADAVVEFVLPQAVNNSRTHRISAKRRICFRFLMYLFLPSV